MGQSPLKWFLPLQNSLGNGLVFPVSEDVRGILRGMRSDLSAVDSAFVDEDDEEAEDTREYRRDGVGGRWIMHN